MLARHSPRRHKTRRHFPDKYSLPLGAREQFEWAMAAYSGARALRSQEVLEQHAPLPRKTPRLLLGALEQAIMRSTDP
jgi:hypothetical protein